MNKKQMEEVRNEYEEFLKNAEKEGFRELTEYELRLEVNGGRDKCKNDKDSNDGKGSEDKRDKKERSDKDKKEGGGAEKKERGVIDRIKDCFGRSNKDKDRSEAKEKSTEQKEKGLLGKAWDGIKDFFSGDKSKEEEKKAEENDSNLNKNGKAKSEENASVKSSQNDELTENSESQDMSTEKHGASDKSTADVLNETSDKTLGATKENISCTQTSDIKTPEVVEKTVKKSFARVILDKVNGLMPNKTEIDPNLRSLSVKIGKKSTFFAGVASITETGAEIRTPFDLNDFVNTYKGDLSKAMQENPGRIDLGTIANSSGCGCPSIKCGVQFKF